jgi:hypothetical protein
MAFTGVDFNKEVERRIDKVYSDYYDPTTQKAFFRRSLQLSITSKYNVLDTQKRYDEIRSLLVYAREVPATTGRILLQPLAVTAYSYIPNPLFPLASTSTITTAFPHMLQVSDIVNVNINGSTGTLSVSIAVAAVTDYTITVLSGAAGNIGTFLSGSVVTTDMVQDYMHLFSVRAAYIFENEDEIDSVLATPSKIEITLQKRSQLRDGNKITISGALPINNGLNGERYVKQIGTRRYRLYNDEELLSPVVATSAYVSGGVITSMKMNSCFQLKPDQYVQKVDAPTKRFPRYQMADNAIIIEPKSNLQYVEMDYIKLPPFEIDPLNNDTDLLLYYSQEFIEYLVDFTARLFDLDTKNMQGLNMDTPQVVTNQ